MEVDSVHEAWRRCSCAYSKARLTLGPLGSVALYWLIAPHMTNREKGFALASTISRMSPPTTPMSAYYSLAQFPFFPNPLRKHARHKTHRYPNTHRHTPA